MRSNNFGQNLSFLASHQFLHLKITRAYLIFKLLNEILRNLALTCHNISKNVPMKLAQYNFFRSSRWTMLVRAGEMASGRQGWTVWQNFGRSRKSVSKTCHQHLSPARIHIYLGNWENLFLLRVQYRFQVPLLIHET